MATRKAPPNFAGNVGKAVMQSKIINCLRGGYGKVLSADDIAEYIAPGANWPLTWKNGLSVHICNLRKKGWPIRTYHGRGYSYDPTLVKAAE